MKHRVLTALIALLFGALGMGLWVVGTRQGVLWFIQPTAKAGYYMTATVGVALF